MFLFSISYTYRTCEQLRFCKDNMNTTHDVLSIKPGTQKFIDNEFIAPLYVNNKESTFNLHIYKISKSGFRIRIDPGTKLSSYRFNISHDNLIVDENKITNKEEVTYETHRLFDVLNAKKNTSALINFDPFFITISRDGRNYISINSENFVFIEDGSETPNTEYDGYIETYPHGKTAVGVDISFLSANARLTGFSEGTYPANLVDTNSSSERHYSRDNYAMYGFVPMLSGHCPDFDIVPTVFWMNPTDMFIQINTKASGRIAKFVSEGGFIDLVVFSNKLEENLQEYSEITGLPPLAPAFAFGYHQSKYGYKSQQEVEGILSKLNEIKFPYDSIWLDIDHLQDFAPFTINYTWFPDPQKFFDDRKKQNRFVIRITDPHLPTNLSHPVYKQAFDNDYFVKNSSNQQAIAPCWPGDSSWPDFFRKDVRNWWSGQFTNWPANVYVWNDMNEIAVFQRIEGTNHKDWLNLNGKIESREIHSSYGLFMTSGTFNGLTNRRPFVLTRSFFAGSQKFSWHWSGDNDASWEHLRLSLDMLISSNLNGLPFTGSDVGGFTGNVSDELHARWFQVGAAVYPFFRQHCAINVNYREPYLYKDNEIFDGMMESTKLRYKMFPLYYTNAYKASKSLKPLVTPLWYTFNDIDHDVNYQLLLDEKVMVCPIVTPNTSTTKVTKPLGI
ncbi:Glycosyl hydrolases family 31 protein [Trichomonas vaginalis G3]|uniref:Maltase n=1 Tax=Trichomonas vaginalis (strain ATCC PRA-98 / G3) TaxID=412133 RepID=A2EXA0_TRIV3|nr:glycosyl hydrolase [Trichomonas vaginalis G3]EAY02699.1 Glycosyl hydrolases family 31 protein [Trichomonas vaginalis G3]KAI5513593.1 alpha-glucosidase family [Trichomonas vaginalis G3]|eukprot:XP_001314922.1 glycosyl hydrolase [Trichomonas vaginalis G3]